MDDRQTNFWSVISAFAIGGLVGAGIMILLAPQTGRDTRKMLMNRSQGIVDRAKVTGTKTGKVIGDFTQQAADRTVNVFRRGKDLSEDIKSNVEGEAKSKSVQFGK